MQYPTNIPVRLIRPFRGRTGNMYLPKDTPYLPGQLPTEAYTSMYVVPEGSFNSLVQSASTTTTNKGKEENANSSSNPPVKTKPVQKSVEEVHWNAKEKEKKENSSLRAKTETVEFTDEYSRRNQVYINDIGFEDLSKLPGVGRATCQKIVDLREEAPFFSYDDLNVRVPLPFGKDWTQFNIKFSSNNKEKD